MRLLTEMLASAAALALAGCSTVQDTAVSRALPIGVELKSPPQRDPSELQVLFWTDAQRSERFRDMESWFAGHEVSPMQKSFRTFGKGEPLSADLSASLKAFMTQSNTAGIMVVQDGEVRFEEYGLDMGPEDRWTSFSVAKSFTSTLLGAAIKDGSIASIDDPVTDYVPELAGSAYDGVTVRQVATMTSGAKWNEDYADPNSDVAQMNRYVVEYGSNATVAQLKTLTREAEPGKKWVYKTGETNLLGLIVENATGMPMAQYAQSKIIQPAGLKGNLFWMVDPRGGNIGGCCLSLTLSDYARMGQFALDGGKGVVPDGWFAEAGAPQVSFPTAGFGYGYQWWTYPGGNFGAQGIFGQGITIVPSKRLVVAHIGNWSRASGGPERAALLALVNRIAAEAD